MSPTKTETARQALVKKLRAARFHHFTGSDAAGVTYQTCRFCKKGFQPDSQHGDNCWFANNGYQCVGLWKYQVRHYSCGPCREERLAGAWKETQ